MMNHPARKIQYKRLARLALGTTLLLLAGACGTPEPPSPTTVDSNAQTSKTAPVSPPVTTPTESPSATARWLTRITWADLPGWREDDQAEALPALLTGCRALAKQAAWREPCEAARQVRGREAALAFFEAYFTPYQMSNEDGTQEGLATGYYEPSLRGSRKRSARYRYPLYAAPPGLQNDVPFLTRAQIDGPAAPLRGQEIAWAEDLIELFFLQVQGSGRLELDDGSVMAVGFAGHNSQPYRSIGGVLIERGELTIERASMQGIKAWARANPSRVQELLNQNPRYVFFRERPNTGASPPGSLGVPLTPRRSVATDPRFVPPGVPVHIATTWPLTDKPLQRLMLAQDTGGAIRGAVRIDFFWGHGENAAREAGRMQQSLRMWVLLPHGHPAGENP